jgi:adenosylmethionine-8-amino-7-oxononanoate aminotransferase
VCKKLLNHLPKSLSRFFFSDNGSTACEVALKMSFQYFFNQNQKDKKIFLHFEGGYHGDTFGAMSVGKTSSFYKPFEGFLFQTESIPFPHTWDDDPSVLEKEKEALIHLDSVINKHKGQICAFIMEVGVQGASGMKMARPVFFNALCKRLKEAGILIIFDEVMTGFYRTGEMFSASLLDISPDFICLSKALSGGFLPLALTVTTEKIYEAFLSPKEGFAFLHGHSFTASPLGCAAAIASLELFEKPALKKKIKAIEKEHKKGLDELKKTGLIEKSSCQGTIARFELKHQEGRILNELKIRLQKQGFIIRPLKGVIYLMPPYAVLLKDLKKAYMILKQEITNLCFSS